MLKDIPALTSRNIRDALRRTGSNGLFIGFSATSCSYCAVHEAEWSNYSNTLGAQPALPHISWIDADKERSLLRRYEVQELPALVLAWQTRWTPYTGVHTRAAMAAFASAQLSPPAVRLEDRGALERLVEQQRSEAASAPIVPVVLLGFFNNLEDEADELEDFTHAAMELRKLRTDTAVRAAYIEASRDILGEYARDRRWFAAAPSAVVLLGGELRRGGGGSRSSNGYRLDERDEDNLSLDGWAARAALPEVGELTHLNFAAYAATSLPMLLAFVAPPASAVAAPLRAVLAAVAARFRGKLCVVTCDGMQHATRMLSLGLRPDAPLPQLAINTKDGRQLPFPSGRLPTEKHLALFVADFLGERLPPPLPGVPSASPPPPLAGSAPIPEANDGWASSEGHIRGTVLDLTLDNFEAIALDVRRDVLVLLHASTGCEACATLAPLYQKVADRVAQLELSAQLAVAQLDVAEQQPLPRALKAVQLHALPTVLMLPAENKEPPVPLFDGSARPKELLYFAQRHASHTFALPPNPHLTREQHDAWKEQVGRLPEDKVARAYQTLYEETGLLKDEV